MLRASLQWWGELPGEVRGGCAPWQEGLQGWDDQSTHPSPASTLCCVFSRERAAEPGMPKELEKGSSSRKVHQTKPSWLVLCTVSSGSLSPPRWGGHFPAPMLGVCGHVVMDVLLAKECGAMEVSKCALFLEGTLSKKCAEKWFGRQLGLEELCFPSA